MIFNRASRWRHGDIGPLRVSDLKKLCRDRYPSGVLPANKEGRAFLEVIIKHLVWFAENEIWSLANCWVPWMPTEEVTEMIETANLLKDRISATDAGRLVNLKFEERFRLKITTMRPADVSEEEFFERCKNLKRLRDRVRQRARREKLKRKTARLKVQLTEREETIYRLLTRRWRRTRGLAEEAHKNAAFRNISPESARVQVHRTLNCLQKKYLVESRLVDGPKNFRAREARRKHTFPVTVK